MDIVMGIIIVIILCVLCAYLSAKNDKTKQEKSDQHFKKVLMEAFEEYDKKTSPFFLDEDEDEK